ncbi:MAG: hypothetical protein WBK96_15465 [Candidatus Manganitrophaceae bacterium]
MMATDFEGSLKKLIQVMESLSQDFENKIEDLRQKGQDEEELQQLVKGAMAMKDAAGIYLSWANHYIAKLNQAEGMEPEDESMIVEK